MTAELDSNLEPATQVKASDQREGRDGPRALPSQRVNIYLKKKKANKMRKQVQKIKTSE